VGFHKSVSDFDGNEEASKASPARMRRPRGASEPITQRSFDPVDKMKAEKATPVASISGLA